MERTAPTDFFVDADGSQGGGAAKRVTVIGEAPSEHPIAEMVGNWLSQPHRAERHVSARETLGHGQQIGNDMPVIDGEPLAGATEA